MIRRYIISDSGHLAIYPNAKGHGKTGQIREGSWLGKSIRIESENNISLNKVSLIKCLIHQHGQTQLKKGWFFGFRASSNDEVMKAFIEATNALKSQENQDSSASLKKVDSEISVQSEVDDQMDPIDPKIGINELILGKFLLQQDDARDYPRGFQLIKEAADQGNVEAQRLTGIMYLEGKVIPQSDIEALKYLKLAADRKDAEALIRLADLAKEKNAETQN